MKIFILQTILSLLLFFGLSVEVRAQYVVIPDANFRAYLQQQYPTCFNGNGEMDTTCADIVNATILNANHLQISDLDGVQYFDNLRRLNCFWNNLTTLPPLPQSLEILDCHLNQLLLLPSLPQPLAVLDCSENQLTSLPAIPSSLGSLFCGSNSMTALPALPQSLRELWCDGNQLTTLPSLPPLLYTLSCSYNRLTSLPALPLYLDAISCNMNELTSLPNLNENLRFLDCSENHLTSLPNLPDLIADLYCYLNNITILPDLKMLSILGCSYNQLASLPPLPETMSFLVCDHNQLICIPTLPQGLEMLQIHNNITNCIPNLPPNCVDCLNFALCPINQNCGVGQAFCSGTAFLDVNQDGILNNNEVNFENYMVSATPGGHYSTITYSGYRLALDTNANSSVAFFNPYPNALNAVPAFHTVVSNGPGEVPGSYDFALQPIPNVNDLQVFMSNLTARPGFDAWANIRVINAGTLVENPLLTVNFPQDWVVTSTIPQGVVNGNTITWQDSSLAIFSGHNFRILLNIPPNIPIGTPYTITASVPIGNDAEPSDNVFMLTDTVSGSYDPNDKSCNTQHLNPGYDPEQELLYTVRFQNTGNDTAFAVVVRDTLSQYLRANTVRIVNTSHPRCDMSFIDNSHVLSFMFPNILLVDSFANEPLSHGFVQFAVKPLPNLPIGTSIENAADIYFDYNAPVRTNTVTTSIDIVSVPQLAYNSALKIYPNPTSGRVRIETPEPMMDGALVVISDMMGRACFSVPCVGLGADVSFDGLPSGVYSASVLSEGRVLYRGMVVRN